MQPVIQHLAEFERTFLHIILVELSSTNCKNFMSGFTQVHSHFDE